jgi:chorismate mutase/prephenate dehydratase
MGKSKTTTAGGGKRKMPARQGGMAATRTKIARLDQQLVRLVQQRAELVRAAGEGASAVSGVDEELLAANGQGPLSARSLRAVLGEVASGCRALVREPRIAVLGPLYSLSHLAALRHFGQSVEFVPVGSVAAVFEEVCRKQSDLGLTPLENSTDGRVADTLAMLVRTGMRICGEVELKIHHALLAKCPQTEVREVYSRPEALAQCRDWLAKHLPSARTIEVTSTSTAAQLACEKPGAAAIASREAGLHYHLETLAENIEDNRSHSTRFAVIGEHAPPRTKHDRTAMLFQMKHRPGALADVMAIFKRNKLNLTRIESFCRTGWQPVSLPGAEREHSILVEFEGHQKEARFRRATAALRRKVLRMEILGSFPAGKVTE